MIRNFLGKILLVLFLLELVGCKWFGSSGDPFLKWSNITIPDGTPTFQQGFKDGCSTTLYSRGNVYYKTRYGYRYDPKLIGSSEYRLGHQRGYTWCFEHIVGGIPMTSFDRYLLPHGNDGTFDMTAGNINSAWGGMFGGVGSIIEVNPKNGFDDAIFGVWNNGGTGALNANPLWAGNSSGQFFGQQ
jgi:hypothetical protein